MSRKLRVLLACYRLARLYGVPRRVLWPALARDLWRLLPTKRTQRGTDDG